METLNITKTTANVDVGTEKHLPFSTIGKYINKELSDADMKEAGDHIARCQRCRETMNILIDTPEKKQKPIRKLDFKTVRNITIAGITTFCILLFIMNDLKKGYPQFSTKKGVDSVNHWHFDNSLATSNDSKKSNAITNDTIIKEVKVVDSASIKEINKKKEEALSLLAEASKKEKTLSEKEKALIEKEKNLTEKEKNLTEKEKGLVADAWQEATVVKQKSQAKKTTKKVDKKVVKRSYSKYRNVYGRITSAQSGQALAGVNVMVPGSNKAYISDGAGNYSIKIPNNTKQLVFIFRGKETTLNLSSGSNKMNISLDPKNMAYKIVGARTNRSEFLASYD